MTSALLVVDVQRGFDDPSRPPRDNPACEANVRALIDASAERGDAIVLVRHDATDPGSTLHPDAPGNAFKPILDGVEADLVLPKRVHSAFHGEVDLDAWLRGRGIRDLIVCGIQTNRCCETTTRVGGDLGYDVRFVLDATHTFDEPAHDARGAGGSGEVLPAALLSRVTAANLDGHFARVVTTAEVVGAPRVGPGARTPGVWSVA
jgi:nicotinamidase-related amidase